MPWINCAVQVDQKQGIHIHVGHLRGRIKQPVSNRVAARSNRGTRRIPFKEIWIFQGAHLRCVVPSILEDQPEGWSNPRSSNSCLKHISSWLLVSHRPGDGFSTERVPSSLLPKGPEGGVAADHVQLRPAQLLQQR